MPDMRELRKSLATINPRKDHFNTHYKMHVIDDLANQLGAKSGGRSIVRETLGYDPHHPDRPPYNNVVKIDFSHGQNKFHVKISDNPSPYTDDSNPLDISPLQNTNPLDEQYVLAVMKEMGIYNPDNALSKTSPMKEMGVLRPRHRNMNEEELDQYKRYLIRNVPNALRHPRDDVWLRRYTEAKWGPQHAKLVVPSDIRDSHGPWLYRGIKDVANLGDEIYSTRISGSTYGLGGRYYTPTKQLAEDYSEGITYGDIIAPLVIRAKIHEDAEILKVDGETASEWRNKPWTTGRETWHGDAARPLVEKGLEGLDYEWSTGGDKELVLFNQRHLLIDKSWFPEDYEIPEAPKEETSKYEIWELPEEDYMPGSGKLGVSPEDIEDELIVIPETGVAVKVGERRISTGEVVSEPSLAAQDYINNVLSGITHTEVLPHRYSVPKAQGPQPSHVDVPLPTVKGASARRMGYTNTGRLRRRRR